MKEYLKYYIGNLSRIRIAHEGERSLEWGDWQDDILSPAHLDLLDIDIAEVKPLLSNLSDMSEEDARGLIEIKLGQKLTPKYRLKYVNTDSLSFESDDKFGEPCFYTQGCYFKQLTAAQFHYLLSKSYDLFGMISAGTALDKTI